MNSHYEWTDEKYLIQKVDDRKTRISANCHQIAKSKFSRCLVEERCRNDSGHLLEQCNTLCESYKTKNKTVLLFGIRCFSSISVRQYEQAATDLRVIGAGILFQNVLGLVP